MKNANLSSVRRKVQGKPWATVLYLNFGLPSEVQMLTAFTQVPTVVIIALVTYT